METITEKSRSQGHIDTEPGLADKSLDAEVRAESGPHIDPDVQRRVVRKIDMHLVPLVTALCMSLPLPPPSRRGT